MTKEDPWFFQMRAEAFASLVLTKHGKALVQPQAGTDSAVDLLVELLKNGKSTSRCFGVQLVAYMDLPNIQNAAEVVLAHFPTNHSEAKFPICIFVIGVRKPEGIYSWAVEPVIEDSGVVLHWNLEANWQTLDEAGAARLLGQVNAWYDALEVSWMPKARHQRSNREQ